MLTPRSVVTRRHLLPALLFASALVLSGCHPFESADLSVEEDLGGADGSGDGTLDTTVPDGVEDATGDDGATDTPVADAEVVEPDVSPDLVDPDVVDPGLPRGGRAMRQWPVRVL